MLDDVKPKIDFAELNHAAMLAVALAEARLGLVEGGIPIGAAIFARRFCRLLPIIGDQEMTHRIGLCIS